MGNCHLSTLEQLLKDIGSWVYSVTAWFSPLSELVQTLMWQLTICPLKDTWRRREYSGWRTESFPFGTQKAGWRTESFPFVTQGSPSPPSLKDLVRTWRTSALKVVPQLIKRIGWNFEILLPEGGLIRGLSVHETKMLPLCYLDLLKNLCVDWSSYIYYI